VAVCALLSCDLAVAQTGSGISRARVLKERSLLETIKQIQGDTGGFSSTLVRPLWDLGILYVQWDRCVEAVAVLEQAARLKRADEGFFTTSQLELFDLMQECQIALGAMPDFQRIQQYRLLITEKTFGRGPEALPMLSQIAAWYEEAGLYISARVLYSGQIDLIKRAGGRKDVRLVEPLRGIARAYRLEYAYGLNSADLLLNRGGWMHSDAKLQIPYTRLDYTGEASLVRALRILEEAPAEHQGKLVETLIDLGDWYLVGERRDEAIRMYKQAWEISTQIEGATALFSGPEPVPFRTSLGVPLRRPPKDRSEFDQFWADLDYTVGRDGRVQDVEVLETNASRSTRWKLVENLSNTRHRPRFEDGEPVATPHVQKRQRVWVQKPPEPEPEQEPEQEK
jgi:tetratricopeptide (TPR) repeat protein